MKFYTLFTHLIRRKPGKFYCVMYTELTKLSLFIPSQLRCRLYSHTAAYFQTR